MMTRDWSDDIHIRNNNALHRVVNSMATLSPVLHGVHQCYMGIFAEWIFAESILASKLKISRGWLLIHL